MKVAEPTQAERDAIARRTRRATLLTTGVASCVGAAVVAVLLIALSPGSPPSEFRVGEAIALFALYLVIGLPLADALSRHFSREAGRTLQQGGTLDARQRAALIAVPWRAALISLSLWAAAAVTFGAYDALRLEDDLVGAVWAGLTILLGGLTTSALVFLLNEGPLRQVYALAFRTDPPTRAEGLGVRMRMALAWALGAGVPLLAIALAFLGVGASDFDSVRTAVLALVVVGLVAGVLITLRTARSVGEPLAALREAVDRVREGDLDAEVAIDDVTEIGLLQAGFNEMVSGLRERARLEDLFGRHVGVEVAQDALRRGVRLGGERREVSALFVDVTGSTALAAKRPPEEVVAMLNALFDAVVRAATREGGWVNKFAGDAALCVFGAPAEQPDHAGRALRAARTLRDEMAALVDRYPTLDAGIGVSSGEAVAGNVGAEQRYEYTVIGDPVNEAARLTEQAKSREARVLASGAAIERAGDEAATWRRADALQLRGRADPTIAYEPAPEESAEAATASGAAPSRGSSR